MSDTVSLIQELSERLDRIENTQREVQDGRARLAHYEKGTMALSEAVAIIQATLEGQEQANATYGNRLDDQCHSVANQVKDVQGTLAELTHEIKDRRKAEDTALDRLIGQIERFDPNACIAADADDGQSDDADGASDETEAAEDSNDETPSDKDGGIGYADGDSG